MAEDQNNEEKPVIERGVKGRVKWYNDRRGYGFVCRHDTSEDLFIHRTAIAKNNPDKIRKSVGQDEELEFDVVKGKKGNEAANVTGPEGAAVKGSDYVPNRRPRRGRAVSKPSGRPQSADGRSGGPQQQFSKQRPPNRMYNYSYRNGEPAYYENPYMDPYFRRYGPPYIRDDCFYPMPRGAMMGGAGGYPRGRGGFVQRGRGGGVPPYVMFGGRGGPGGSFRGAKNGRSRNRTMSARSNSSHSSKGKQRPRNNVRNGVATKEGEK